MHKHLLLAASILAASCASAPRRSVPDRAPVIGSIRITTEPLFSTEEAKRGGFYRVANAITVQTSQAQIRGFLLFHEGDPFDEAKIHETERNLRSLDFLKSVDITVSPPHDGVVDITVATQDAFTTDVNADFSNDGGKSLYDIDLSQKNLFGTGSGIDLRTANLRERRTNSVEFTTPQIFGHRWTADVFAANSSDGHEEKVAIARPLDSYATRYTLDSVADVLRQDSRIYEEGQVASLFAQEHRALTILPGIAIASRPGTTTRLLGGIDFLHDAFTPIQGEAPDDRDFRFLELGIDTTSLRFLSMTNVNLGLKEEDFTLGTHGSFLIGRTGDGIWRFTADGSYGYAFDQATFVTTRLVATRRSGATNANAIVSSDSWFVKQWPFAFPNTLVVRNRFDVGRDVDRDVQFFADGQNGLRAYPNFAFAGTRRFVFNAEDRLYLGREVLQLFEPAVAVFADIGTAANTSLIHQKLRSDFGLGLRLGIARYESAMLRFDFAYAAADSPTSKKGLVFSFATSQAF